MRFFTQEECLESAKMSGFRVDLVKMELVRPSADVFAVGLNLEQAKAEARAISKMVTSWLSCSSSALLWITQFGIWPSRERWELYYNLRRSLGDDRSVETAPGHHSDWADAALVEFFELALRFGWGGYLLGDFADARGTLGILSHDGWLAFETPMALDTIIVDLEGMGLVYQRFD
jgi:hypothetical protein